MRQSSNAHISTPVKLCTLEGCGKRANGRYCHMHNKRLERTGSLELKPRVPAKELPLDAEVVRAAFSYDPDTGLMTSRIACRQRQPGSQFGQLNDNGYLRGSFQDRLFYVQRLIWLYVYGQWPKGDVDHINGVKTDNRLCNLRDVDRATNALNRHISGGMAGILGAQASGGRFQCFVKYKGTRLYMGRFKTPEEAGEARKRGLAILTTMTPHPGTASVPPDADAASHAQRCCPD